MSKVFKTLVAALLLGCVWVSCKESEVPAYEGTYLDQDRSDPNLVITPREDGRYSVYIGIYRLTTLDDGIGTVTGKGLAFTATDAGGAPIGGLITVDRDTAVVTFTDSTWPLLENGASFTYVRKREEDRSAVVQPQKSFTTVKELPITSVKNQYRSGTCWDYATLGFFESEILRKTGKTYDLCEMFVVNKDYMDCATHYVRMHGFSQISEGGSCDDVADVIRRYGICPEEAMPLPGSLVGEPYANFKTFFPELERTVSAVVWSEGKPELNRFTAEEQAPLRNKRPVEHWRDSVQAVIDKYVGKCPETFEYEGVTYTPQSFARHLGLNMDDYVSLTSYTHHPFGEWFVLEAPYKWRLKPSYNIPIGELMAALDKAIDKGYTVAWGGDVSGDFLRKEGLAYLPEGVVPTQELRQEQWDKWEFTYDHVMLIYGKAVDEGGEPYYLVKNSWGEESGPYGGIWYMSRDYMALNTTYIYLNREALDRGLLK